MALMQRVSDNYPMYGDVWEQAPTWPVGHRPRFSVMHVCGHHEPPCVTGYWHDHEGLNPSAHDTIPLPVFLDGLALVEREDFDV